ncbi:AAA family ATPase [Aliivibrio fischeri]|uniref:AAA family ATPase n=1 Tax=Aliivibrio fischeri TaxID=668 RepID=UPI0012DA0EFE|nr:hypothetical protein [Aliivibrio fischeri]MUK65673.1 hypothetical protein [Aliivibrio fischeri]
MANLRVNKLNYFGDQYIFESEIFNSNIILIEADNGTGKSTFCELIYFALGGNVNIFKKEHINPHKQITRDTNNYVELFISISEKSYLLKRFIYNNEIIVAEYKNRNIDNEFTPEIIENTTQILPIYRSEDNKYIFSDWILEELKINVIELFQGYQSFKINFTDLLRLIYHDQQLDPESIYKRIDKKNNFYADSEMLRKAIFELLIGNIYSSLYSTISEEKNNERKYNISKSITKEFKNLIKILNNKSDLKQETLSSNKDELLLNINNHEKILECLYLQRKSLVGKEQPLNSSANLTNPLKEKLKELEIKLRKINNKIKNISDEKILLHKLIKERNKEISTIEKIIHTHNNLALFTSDTCPYCLQDIERIEGHCICGTPLNSASFERFTYTTREYTEIFKSKLKSRATIISAIKGCSTELVELTFEKKLINNSIDSIQNEIDTIISNIGYIKPIDIINDIDNNIIKEKESILQLEQEFSLIKKLIVFTENEIRDESNFKITRKRRKEIEIDVKNDMRIKIREFNNTYNTLLINTLPDCESAKINSNNYMPIINGGDYLEASAKVSTRLMYFLTLLKLSISNDNIPFPKFLLIDTPETAGIESEYLVKCLSMFEDLENSCQVIISTGLNKYPESLKKYRKLHLPNKDNRLLKKRDNASF